MKNTHPNLFCKWYHNAAQLSSESDALLLELREQPLALRDREVPAATAPPFFCNVVPPRDVLEGISEKTKITWPKNEQPEMSQLGRQKICVFSPSIAKKQ